MPTNISWATETWNPTLGCTKVSPGCDGCYAIRQARIREANPNAKIAAAYEGLVARTETGVDWTGRVNLLPDRLDAPLHWREPRRIFVDSMSDLFHDEVSDEFIARVFAVMAATPQHTYQILTKRHGRMRSVLRDECRCGRGHAPGVHLRSAMEWASTPHSPTFVPGLSPGNYHRTFWPLPNVWLGVSVEDQQRADLRIPALLNTPAAVRWLSCEPLLGPVDLSRWMPAGRAHWQCGGCRAYFAGAYRDQCPSCQRVGHWTGSHAGNERPNGQPISWVVAGGESGPTARPMHPDWARSLRDQCTAASVPFHMKQAGTVLAREWGACRSGKNPAEWPEQFPREYPNVT